MPGSMTIGHTDALVMLSHADAERLAAMLREMSRLMGRQPADVRLSDAQIGALSGGEADRDELAAWSWQLAEYLRQHL
ncbi:hypothetical protein [Kitasatospora terrestris]|uniref:Uncharacterized protein n=1 Tax=Kitasatospora terrestris TaxID=258051 RepID=A0ABP9DPW9_9ACTN